MLNLEIDLRNNNVAKAVLAGDHYELLIDNGDIQAKLKFDFHIFDKLADDFRALCNEKTYQQLEDDVCYLEVDVEELEAEVECLREANEMLRRR